MQQLPLAAIRLDGDTQPRAEMDWDYVNEIAADLMAGIPMDPVDVFYDGEEYWLADGFHRYHAYSQSDDVGDPPCRIHKGTVEDAQWFSYQANRTHGQRRTNADKQQAVEKSLSHPNGKTLSDRLIAEHCGVSHVTVAKYRDAGTLDESTGQIDQLPQNAAPPAVTKRTGRDGRKRAAPKAAAKGKPAPNIVDQLGNVVTIKGAQAAFGAGTTAIREAQAAIQQIRKQVKAVATGPAGRFLAASQLDTDLRNAWQGLKHGVPYAIVPPGVKEKRWSCGYMNRTDYDNLPSEKKHA